MRLLTFSSLYPNSQQPRHGIFVEQRLRHLVSTCDVQSKVVAPVPWFPSDHPRFGEYAIYPRVPREETRHGIEIAHPRYPVIPKVGMNLAPILMAAALWPTMKRMLRSQQYDLIDAHYFYPDGVAAILLGQRLNKPVVITARGSDLNLIPQYQIPRRMIQWAARNAAGLITVSHALKDVLISLGTPEQRINVLTNGVDLNLFHPTDDRKNLRNQLNIKGPTLLSVGNLVELKGHDLVIWALRELPQFRLLIAGDGPEKQKLADLAQRIGVEDRLTFLGTLPHDQLREYYSAADIFILASSREGMPNVLLEALACGTPVVATRVGGIPEVVTRPEAGILVDRHPQALAKGVQTLLANYPERTATRQYAETFGWDKTSHGQFELFRRILDLNSSLHPS